MAGLGKAFQQFGAKGRKPRWSWSASTPDNGTVVLALWDDLFDWKASPVSYAEWDRANTER